MNEKNEFKEARDRQERSRNRFKQFPILATLLAEKDGQISRLSDENTRLDCRVFGLAPYRLQHIYTNALKFLNHPMLANKVRRCITPFDTTFGSLQNRNASQIDMNQAHPNDGDLDGMDDGDLFGRLERLFVDGTLLMAASFTPHSQSVTIAGASS